MPKSKYIRNLGKGEHEFDSRDNTIRIKLTQEQEEKLRESKDFVHYALDEISFFHPNQVTSYYCGNCHQSFSEAPGIDAYIRLECILKNKPQAVANLLCKCKHCDKTLHMSTILDGLEKIPADFILIDETGDYKKPTPESIEERLKQAEDRAKDAFLDSDGINVCRRWAEKIGYKLDEERIKKLEPIQREAYLRNFEKNLPDLIEEIRKDSYAFKLGASAGDEECSMFEGTGLAEQVDKLLENLPHINLPEDKKLREKILKILFQYRKMYDNAIEQTINEKAEMEKKFNEDIQSCQNVSRKTTHLITQYCERAGIGKETLDKIADDAIIPFPLDEIEDDEMPF